MPSVSQDAKPRLRRTDELRFASFRAVRHASLPTDTATNFLCSELEVVRLSIVLVPEHVEPEIEAYITPDIIGHRSSPRARSRARGRHTTCAGQKSDAAKAWRASWSETHRAARRICSWTLRPSRPLRFLRSHLPGGRKPHALSIRWMKSLVGTPLHTS